MCVCVCVWVGGGGVCVVYFKHICQQTRNSYRLPKENHGYSRQITV